jgi:hypothetical protein
MKAHTYRQSWYLDQGGRLRGDPGTDRLQDVFALVSGRNVDRHLLAVGKVNLQHLKLSGGRQHPFVTDGPRAPHLPLAHVEPVESTPHISPVA